jgi:hypothetical protein
MAALGMQQVAGEEFGDLTLLGYDAHKLGFDHLPDAPLRPGEILHVNLYWQAGDRPEGDWSLGLALIDSSGQVWASLQADPVAGYPTSRWRKGDVWRGQFNLAVPTNAPGGRYRLRVGTIAPDGTAVKPYLSGAMAVEP